MGRGNQGVAEILYGKHRRELIQPVESPMSAPSTALGVGKNTLIQYLYRDADNYKSMHSEVITGAPTKEGVQKILARLEDGDSFIPEQVGLQPLQENLQTYDTEPGSQDHCWHELEEDSFQATDQPPTLYGIDFEQLVTMFEETQWDPGQSQIIGI